LGSDLAIVVGVSMLLCVVSAWAPARRAASVNPAEALHDA
jgi:ABC-type lipoprotein release transport system permease subunit